LHKISALITDFGNNTIAFLGREISFWTISNILIIRISDYYLKVQSYFFVGLWLAVGEVVKWQLDN